jgi:glycosyltransferase involved in cell wall biosynthesis
MIVASLPTIPQRRQTCLHVVRRILFEQTRPPDVLHLWLNGYTEVPAEFPTDARIHYHLHPENPGPWIRYKVVDELSDHDVLVTIDDDLVYPCDYVEKGLEALVSFPETASVSFGGVVWDSVVPQSKLQYSKHKRLIDCTTRLDWNVQVPVLLGGAAFHRPAFIRGFAPLLLPGFATNDDLMISYHLQQHGGQIISAAKPAQWIQVTEAQHAAHALWRRDRLVRERTFQLLVNDMHFNPYPLEKRALPGDEIILYVTDHEISDSEGRELLQRHEQTLRLHTLELLSERIPQVISRPLRKYDEHFVRLICPEGRFESLPLVKEWRHRRVAKQNARSVLEYLDWIHSAGKIRFVHVAVDNVDIRRDVCRWVQERQRQMRCQLVLEDVAVHA